MQDLSSCHRQTFVPCDFYTTEGYHAPLMDTMLNTSPAMCINPNLLTGDHRSWPQWALFDNLYPSLPTSSDGPPSTYNPFPTPTIFPNQRPLSPCASPPTLSGVENTESPPPLNHPSTARFTSKRKAGYESDVEYIDKPRKKVKLNRGFSLNRRRKTQPPEDQADLKQYICDRDGCKMSFKRSRDLERHGQSLKHSDPKFVCECKAAFTRPDPLKRHKNKSCKLLLAKN